MINLSMHDLLIFAKGLVLILFVWIVDFITIQFVSLSFISPGIREFFTESKDIINWVVSALVLYATVLKIRNEKRKGNE